MYEAWFSIDRRGTLTGLQRAAIIGFFVHLLAGVGMALILRHGLDTNPALQDRWSFLCNHRILWSLGWLTWTATALTILYFYIAFAAAHQANTLWQFAVLLSAAAIGPDLAAQAVEIGVLPEIAHRAFSGNSAAELFMDLHRTAVMMSGFVANGLYTLPALILALSTRQAYPFWIWIAGVAVAVFYALCCGPHRLCSRDVLGKCSARARHSAVARRRCDHPAHVTFATRSLRRDCVVEMV
jgi:hypothetical protein